MHDLERRARRALACVCEGGDLRLAALLERIDADELWRLVASPAAGRGAGAGADAWQRRAAALDLDGVEAAERRLGARFVIPSDDEWPEGLSALHCCAPVQELGGEPAGLWARGRLPLQEALAASVAVVGSRASTQYGDRVATGLAADLASAGVPVVSGGAFGIDAAAHRGALAEGGVTVAFLACGLDEPYPKANERLLEQAAASGALVSEYPPGSRPTRPRFLARNRLIAAASRGTVIVEAAARSGARNTVTWATGCGRPVMAVPGPVGNATSFTPHRLIREGEATLVTTADEVRELVEPLGTVEVTRPRSLRLLDTLTDRERAAYEALPARGGRDAADISLRSGLRVPDCLGALAALASGGLARRRPDGRWGLGPVADRPLLPGLDVGLGLVTGERP